jgi:hypothetical protein
MLSIKIFNVCLLQKNNITEDQMVMNRTALCKKDTDKEQQYFSQH